MRNCGLRREPRRRWSIGILAAVLVSSLTAGGSAGEPAEPDAIAVLEAMSEYVAGLETISLAFDSDIEVITTELEKIQFASSGTAVVQRPDKIHAHRIGGFADVEMWFDGSMVSIYGRSIDAFARFELPGTLDHFIEAMRAGHGVALPGADLLLTNAFEVLAHGVLEAKHMGSGVVGGVECEHLAFRNADTDWQLWVEAGSSRIPRKMVITSKTIAGAPQYTIRITDWQSGFDPAAGAFVFEPPPEAEQVSHLDLIHLDELPQDTPVGGTQ